jgi:hypothetical protein
LKTRNKVLKRWLFRARHYLPIILFEALFLSRALC